MVSALALGLMSACQSGPMGADDRAVLPEWRSALADRGPVRGRWLPLREPIGPLDPQMTLVVVDPNWRLPEQAWHEQVRQHLRDFVLAGGRLLLFGHAVQLAAQIGIEPEVPECSVYRWGYDARALEGRAELQLAVVSGRTPELFEGLQAVEGEFRYSVAGAAPATLPLCAWQIGEPQTGEVLARLGEVRDGIAAPPGPPVLLRWRVGKGQVLACGIVPALRHSDETVRHNAQTFVQRCVDWARQGGAPILLAAVPERGPVATFAGDPRDVPPMAPWLAHWGWQASMYDGDEADAVRPPDELAQQALVPSWLSGADVFELGLTDPQHGAPISWSARDPIERPLSWRGDALALGWGSGGFQRFADQAHTRGLLLFGGLDPLPVGDRPTERLVALRMLARELASVRRFGGGALDGFGIRQWWPDARGFGLAMVEDFQPAATIYSFGERTPPMAGALRGLDADDGAPRGLSLAGIADGWRDGFAADLFPIGVLDARVLGDRWPGNGVRGGGSAGDWLVRQMNDFVRARRLTGGTALWRRHDPRTLGPDTVAYVHGLGLEPLRAAVATPLAATGSDGIRAAAATLLPRAPAGFGGEVDAPAAVHVLQNNWFRLLGSGGALAFDAHGLGRFDGEALTISPAFLRTRLFGARPDGQALLGESRDFLVSGYRGEGGYGRTARIGTSPGGELTMPALLAFDQAPRWPAVAEFDWQPTPGYHELTLQLRGERGQSLVAISLDGVLLHCLSSVGVGRVPETVVPVHVARGGPRVLRIEVLDGNTVAIDRLRVHRRGDVGVEAAVTVPAGSVAQLVEHSFSSFHEEHVTLTALADSPGFVLHTSCQRAARSLRIERRLTLPAHVELAAGTDGDEHEARRLPFVLRARDAAMPDLCVVPLQLARYEHVAVAAGELIWRSAPEAGLTARIGFLFCPHGQGEALLPHAARLLDTVDRPLPIDLGADGCASLVTDLPVAWNRLLRIESDVRSPFLVREGGLWTWRGSQPAARGGVWLRVHQAPGDVVEIVGGPAVLARTRPGPGSLRILALQDQGAHEVTVHVLQPSRLRAPSVVMAADFDEVLVDDRPWAWFDGRTVFLPDVPGRYRIVTRSHGGSADAHVRSTRAPLTRCAYDPASRELVLVTAVDSARPAELPWTAVLDGPVPTSIENGEVVDVATLHLPDAAAEATALRGGVLIRFRSGVTRVRYGDDAK